MGINEEVKSRASLPQATETFSLFIISVDGMLGKEAQVILSTLNQLMAAKMVELILHVKGWVNGHITIVVVKLYYQMS